MVHYASARNRRFIAVHSSGINELLDGVGDVVNHRSLKPLLRDNILHDAIHAF